MSEPELPPFDEDLEGILAAGRGLVEGPLGAKERLRARLSAKIPPGGGGGAGATSAIPKVPLWTLGPVLVLGGVLGFAGGRSTTSAEAPRARLVLSADAVVPSVSPQALASEAVPPSPSPARAVASAPSAASASPVGDLKAERAILDVARTALGRGDGENALAAVTQHQRKFPNGVLAEEREAIAVQALILTNRNAEAQARIARFRARYPTSLLLPALEAATTKEGP